MSDEEGLLSEYDGITSSASKSFRNFLLFSILFSINHATIDGVLAFASSELGSVTGFK
jgi:hypothetical protein